MALAIPWSSAADEPIRLHSDNPHYFLWRGRPVILITSGEHYGAVLNLDFDYQRYLETLESYGFNLTRVFSGVYCEGQRDFGIRNNTLAPAEGRLLCPWARSDRPGYARGGNKFDLSRWDSAYFERLRAFVTEASRRDVVVEIVMFCPFYSDSMWKLSPLNAGNNTDGIGGVPRWEVFTLKHSELLAVQEAMVRKIVEKLNEFDNVYYEICNEPYERSGQTESWQARMARTIFDAESRLPSRHLIAQNFPWRDGHGNWPKGVRKKLQPVPHVSILNFHGPNPIDPLELHYDLNKVLACDETGPRSTTPHRLDGWDFVLAGGAVYDHLGMSYAVGHEDGSFQANPRWGDGPTLRRQLQILKQFIDGFEFIRMRPDCSVIRGRMPKGAMARALVERGRAYAIYLRGGTQATLQLELPRGEYVAEWINTKTGRIARTQRIRHGGGTHRLSSPSYTDDIALRILLDGPGNR